MSYTCEDCGHDVPAAEPAFRGQINEPWFDRSELGSQIDETMGRSPEEVITICPICLYELLEEPGET